MVHVTDMALDRLKIVREENALPADQGIAIVPREEGEIGFLAATPQADDEVIERDGKPLLFVPANFAETFNDLVIDFADTPEMTGFTISQVR